MAESMKNSEFVSLVAELLEINLRALDRTEKRVADHVGLVDDEPEATATAKRQPPLAPAPRCGHNHNHNHNHRTRSSSRQPFLVTQARADARSASAPRDETPPRQRRRQQAWSTAPSPAAPRQRRDNSLLSSSTPLRTASPVASADAAAGGGGGGNAARKGRRPPAAPAAAARRRQASRQRSASRTAPTVRGGTQRICTDNGCLVTATAVETGTTPAERNALYARVLDAVDVVLQLPPHEGLQAYHGTHRRTRQLLIYKEYLSLPVLSSCARKMSGLMKREAIKRLLYGVLTALDHLHRRCDVAHGYVRCSSIFADASAATTKLSVPLLEWAASAEGEWVGREGPYLPPEQLREGGLPPPTPEGDVWAVGCVAMELLTGFRPWQHLAQSREAVRRVLCSSRPLPLPKGVEGEEASFLTACFALPPKDRRATGARGLMEHSFFASVRPTIFARGSGGGEGGGSPQPLSPPAPTSSFHDAVAFSPAAAAQAAAQTRDASCSPLHQSLLAQRVSGLPAPLDATACAASGGGAPGVASTAGSPLVATRVHSHASTAVSGTPAGGFARGGGGVLASPLTPGSGPGSAVLWKASSAPPSVRRAGTAPSSLRKAKTAGGGGGLASVAAPKAAAPRAVQDAAALRELQEKAEETEARVRRVEDTMQLISQRQEVTNNMLCSIAGSLPGTPQPMLGHASMLSTGEAATPVRPLLAAAAPVQQQAAYAPYSPPPAGPAYATSVPPQHPFSSAWSAYPELHPAGAPIVISR